MVRVNLKLGTHELELMVSENDREEVCLIKTWDEWGIACIFAPNTGWIRNEILKNGLYILDRIQDWKPCINMLQLKNAH